MRYCLTDPYVRGCYVAALPGRFFARAELARPVEDRLFFAGEATHECFMGEQGRDAECKCAVWQKPV